MKLRTLLACVFALALLFLLIGVLAGGPLCKSAQSTAPVLRLLPLLPTPQSAARSAI